MVLKFIKLHGIPKARVAVQGLSPWDTGQGNRLGASAKHRQVGPEGKDTGLRGGLMWLEDRLH